MIDKPECNRNIKISLFEILKGIAYSSEKHSLKLQAF